MSLFIFFISVLFIFSLFPSSYSPSTQAIVSIPLICLSGAIYVPLSDFKHLLLRFLQPSPSLGSLILVPQALETAEYFVHVFLKFSWKLKKQSPKSRANIILNGERLKVFPGDQMRGKDALSLLLVNAHRDSWPEQPDKKKEKQYIRTGKELK